MRVIIRVFDGRDVDALSGELKSDYPDIKIIRVFHAIPGISADVSSAVLEKLRRAGFTVEVDSYYNN